METFNVYSILLLPSILGMHILFIMACVIDFITFPFWILGCFLTIDKSYEEQIHIMPLTYFIVNKTNDGE